MILIDNRVGSKELLEIIRRIGLEAETTHLEYGDACFTGNGPNGTVMVGVERKTLNDMLQCIEDARYSERQLPGMRKLYSLCFLALEGLWAAGNGNGFDGVLMQGFRGGQSWGPLRHRTSRTTAYSKLFRYLVSVSMADVRILYPPDIFQTAYQICELYQYFQKPWHKHTSLLSIQKPNIPTLTGKPSLVRRWAESIDDVGVEYGMEAERLVKSGRALANLDEEFWATLTGKGGKRLGGAIARRIVAEINGWRR